jgi:hypothetical protein
MADNSQQVTLNDVYLRIGTLDGKVEGLGSKIDDLDSTVTARCVEHARQIANIAEAAKFNAKAIGDLVLEKAEAKGAVKGGMGVGRIAVLIIMYLLGIIASAVGAAQLVSQQPDTKPARNQTTNVAP